MANGYTKLSERVASIETKFETVVIPMANKIDDMYIGWPEISRKVNEHHKMYNDLKAARCSNVKVMPDKRPSDGNGGYVERRAKKPLLQQFKELTIAKKISTIVVIITFFGAFGEWILDKSHSILYLLENIFK